MSLNDQFEYGRIPLKPLAYKNKDLAGTNELIVDYGEDASYHIYISDSNDPKKLIDITNLIIKEILPNAKINGNQFQINIEGIDDPTSLQDILNFIYKRFTYAEDPNGFDYNEDISKVYDPTTKTVLLRTTDGTIQLPITLADNVYDSSGKSLQERLNNMTRLGFSISYLRATEENQTEFEFEYPFANYSDFFEIRIGTVYVDKSRYYITNDLDEDGNYTSAKITFINDKIEIGRRIDILFMYNALAKTDGALEYMAGSNIANASISSIKLEKISDSYTLNDPTSVASSAAIYNLYSDISEVINTNSNNVIWTIDSDTSNNNIYVYLNNIPEDTVILANILIRTEKLLTTTLTIETTIDGSRVAYNYPLIYPDGSGLHNNIAPNKVLKVLLNTKDRIAHIVTNAIRTSRFIRACIDQETVISYTGLEYSIDSIINVYRNGVRLFEDIDYSINRGGETITLFVRTSEGERIIFEALTM